MTLNWWDDVSTCLVITSTLMCYLLRAREKRERKLKAGTLLKSKPLGVAIILTDDFFFLFSALAFFETTETRPGVIPKNKLGVLSLLLLV